MLISNEFSSDEMHFFLFPQQHFIFMHSFMQTWFIHISWAAIFIIVIFLLLRCLFRGDRSLVLLWNLKGKRSKKKKKNVSKCQPIYCCIFMGSFKPKCTFVFVSSSLWSSTSISLSELESAPSIKYLQDRQKKSEQNVSGWLKARGKKMPAQYISQI